ncbi:hypothetical protein LTR04_001275, partial [Oleoguttula sp. CCFEE 6159]
MSQSDIEPFPPLSPHAHFARKESANTRPRQRRKSSSLGGEIRGDTGAAALATLSEERTPPPQPTGRSASEKARPHSKRRKAKTLLRRWRSLSLRHTWINPLLVCLAVFSAYAVNPRPSNPFHSAIFLSYPLPPQPGADPQAPTQYGKGVWDFAFVAFYTVLLSFTREFLMQRLIRPLAIRAGVKSRAKLSRFMEQSYTALYFGIFGPYGLYVMSRTPVWYFNTTAMFEQYPHKTHDALFKAYYLLQASYWAQQGLVLLLMLEKPRKDFKELVAHHVITLSLIWLSYRFHFTYMGLAVYITHDISDFFLATSKTLNYLSSPIVGPYFALFILVWTYLRHYINLHILYATLTEFHTVGPYTPRGEPIDWLAEQYKCWISQPVTFALLACLQAVNLFWLALIAKIAWRFVVTKAVDDERSEYEEEEEEDEGEGEEKKVKALEAEREEGEVKKGAPQVLLNGEPVE